MSTSELDSDLVTPRDEEYWEPFYSKLALLADWGGWGEDERARRLLERIEQELHSADTPAQIKALLHCSPEEKLKTVEAMIRHFSQRGKSHMARHQD
jgi:hypothetical protein